MNEFGDYKSEMFNEPLSDEAIEAIVDGASSAPESFAFARLTNDINRVATGPMPMPSAALAAMMQMNISTETLMQQMVASDETFVADDSQLSFWRRKKMAIGQFITGLGIVGKLTLGTGVAFASTAGAAGAGVLPAPVQHEVSRVVETVTPFKVRDPKAERAEKKREEERVTPPSTLPTLPVRHEAPPTTLERHEPTTAAHHEEPVTTIHHEEPVTTIHHEEGTTATTRRPEPVTTTTRRPEPVTTTTRRPEPVTTTTRRPETPTTIHHDEPTVATTTTTTVAHSDSTTTLPH